jgi:hypothetical protein
MVRNQEKDMSASGASAERRDRLWGKPAIKPALIVMVGLRRP